MVVCKYFLQGTCKFGNMCKFEHEISNSYQNSGSSILRSSNFGSSNFTQPKVNPINTQEKSSVDTSTLVKSVVSDMMQAEKGGQWLFSSYAPFKEKPAFPGFEDQSFEELRYGYYEAVKAGTVEQFKQQLQRMVQETLLKVRSLQNPSPDIVMLINNIYKTPPSSQAGVYSGNAYTNTSASNFSFKTGGISQQSTSIFAQSNQSIFGNSQQQQQQQTVFNSPENMFGGKSQNVQNQTTNAFSALPVPSQGQTSGNSIFAQTKHNVGIQGNTSIFGAEPSIVGVNSGPMFNNSQAASSNIFAAQNQHTNIFQSVSQAPNVFGSAPTQTTVASQMPNMFVSPNNTAKTPLLPIPSTNVFNIPLNNQFPQLQQTQIVHPQQNQSNQASNYSNSNSVMAPLKNENPQAYTNSIFRNVSSNTSNFQGPHDQTLYSKLEDLTHDEIKWFESDDMDILKIPEKPPTYEMCFKV